MIKLLLIFVFIYIYIYVNVSDLKKFLMSLKDDTDFLAALNADLRSRQ